MTAEFHALVQLCRAAHTKSLDSATLSLRISLTDEARRWIETARSFRDAEVKCDGQGIYDISSQLTGCTLDLKFGPLSSSTKVLVGSLSDLLQCQGARFRVAPPPEYYLLEEDYASGEVPSTSLIDAYHRIPVVIEILARLADVVLLEDSPAPVYVLLAKKRLDIIPAYGYSNLSSIPTTEELNQLSAELFSDPFVSDKTRIAKQVLLRQLEDLPAGQRFAVFLDQFEELANVFRTDFELFKDEFNFEKVRESFEQKRVDFLIKLDAAGADILNKLLAIPVAQGLLVSQLKAEPAAAVANIGLLMGSILFALIALIFVRNQQHVLKQIDNEIAEQKLATNKRFPLLARRLKENFESLTERAEWQKRSPWWVLALLATSTFYTVYAFSQVPPADAWWGVLQRLYSHLPAAAISG